MLPLKYLFENFDLAKEVLKNYDYSEMHLDEMLSHFRISSNAIYPFLTESRKVCFLRLSPTKEKAPAEVESELRFICWLRDNGYPIMKPYPMKDGLLRDVIETKWGTYNVTCFEGVEGDTLEDADGDVSMAYGYGKMLAELHNLSEVYPYADERQSCFDMLNEVKARFECYDAPGFLLTALDEVQKELSLLPTDKAVFGLIHYDFEPDNVLYDEENDSFGVIDPDDSIRCWYALDVVRAIDAMGDVVEEDVVEEAVSAFLDGYRSKRTLTRAQMDIMPLMRKLVALQEYATILHVLHEELPDEPDWMLDIRKKLGGRAAAIHTLFSGN